MATFLDITFPNAALVCNWNIQVIN